MLSDLQLFILCILPLLLWFYPALKWLNFNWKVLILHLIIQVIYSLLFIWLISRNPGKGHMSIYMFYWFYISVIHLLGLNIWTYLSIKSINKKIDYPKKVNNPIKATSREYKKSTFYLEQHKSNEKRYVISLLDGVRIQTLLAGFINKAGNNVEIKIRDFKESDSPIDYTCTLSKSQAHQLIVDYKETIFHYGFHDFMIRLPETNETIVFDDHGLLFIYTTEDYSGVLKNMNVPFKPKKKLIYEYSHWHYGLENGEEKLLELIEKYNLIKLN